MSPLRLMPNLDHPDDVYQLLVDLHAGLDESGSTLVSAKLLLLLVNHVGDEAVIREAVAIARTQAQAGQEGS